MIAVTINTLYLGLLVHWLRIIQSDTTDIHKWIALFNLMTQQTQFLKRCVLCWIWDNIKFRAIVVRPYLWLSELKMSAAQLALLHPSEWYNVWITHPFQWSETNSVVDLLFPQADKTVQSPLKICQHHIFRWTHFKISNHCLLWNFWNVINVWCKRKGTSSSKVCANT